MQQSTGTRRLVRSVHERNIFEPYNVLILFRIIEFYVFMVSQFGGIICFVRFDALSCVFCLLSPFALLPSRERRLQPDKTRQLKIPRQPPRPRRLLLPPRKRSHKTITRP